MLVFVICNWHTVSCPVDGKSWQLADSGAPSLVRMVHGQLLVRQERWQADAFFHLLAVRHVFQQVTQTHQNHKSKIRKIPPQEVSQILHTSSCTTNAPLCTTLYSPKAQETGRRQPTATKTQRTCTRVSPAREVTPALFPLILDTTVHYKSLLFGW